MLMGKVSGSVDKLNVLALSDQVVDRIYSQHVREMFADVDIILACGDLPYYYLEYVMDTLNVPMFFVHGNHDPEVEISHREERTYPWGGIDLHRKTRQFRGFLFAGLEGSIQYSMTLYQYSQIEMWGFVIGMVPRLLLNKLRYGRYLDVLVTHSPARGVGDGEDVAHRGFSALRWLLKTFRPAYHFHGHVHKYDRRECEPMLFEKTLVVNTCNYQLIEISVEEVSKDD